MATLTALAAETSGHVATGPVGEECANQSTWHLDESVSIEASASAAPQRCTHGGRFVCDLF